jgi:hypothetical protein
MAIWRTLFLDRFHNLIVLASFMVSLIELIETNSMLVSDRLNSWYRREIDDESRQVKTRTDGCESEA